MRTVLFQHTGIKEMTTEILSGINDTDLAKEHDLTIPSALGDFISQTARFSVPRPPKSTRSLLRRRNYREITLPARHLCRFDIESTNQRIRLILDYSFLFYTSCDFSRTT